MASRRSRMNQATTLHRQAAAITTAAATALDRYAPKPRTDEAQQRELAERMRALAPRLAPGWLGAPLNPPPTGGPYRPAYVRVGTAHPLDFPVIVPLVGTGHLAFDADARDSRVAAALRALLLRLVAAAPPGSLLVRAVDAVGTTFDAFAPLTEAGLMPPPVTDCDGLRAVLAEADHRVRAKRRLRQDRTLLLVVASLPALTEDADLARISALAEAGPAAGLHLVVAGWAVPLSTQVSLRNPYAVVSDQHGATLADPVSLDTDPPAQLIDQVCRQVAAQSAVQDRLTLTDVLPDAAEGLWTDDPAEQLAVTVGLAGEAPLVLRFNEMTPHWMVCGRPGAGKTAFLVNVLYGLSMKYGPDDLALYLVDLTKSGTFADFVPSEEDASWLPHARAVSVAPDRAYALAVLRELDAEMGRRAGEGARLPRILCVVEEFPVLLAGTDEIAGEAAGLLDSLARKGRSYGIHLVLTGRTVEDAPVFGQFPVRIALPGGDAVLDPTNDSAAGLPVGTAVVNTAGGLGGPRGATRGHEKVIRFPDPHADQATLTALRSLLWTQRPPDAHPPAVFARHGS